MIDKLSRVFYVYIHKRKSNGKIFYVGKGQGDRASSEEARNIWWKRIVEKEGGFIHEILYDKLTDSEALLKEKELISEININNLCNISPGGSGGDTLTRHPNIKEIGKKISVKCIGKLNPNSGVGYYKRWIQLYGQEEADRRKEELKRKRKSKIRKKSNRKYKPWKQLLQDVYGDAWIEKYNEINNKIREQYFNRPKIECEYCNQLFFKNNFKRHELSCKKKNVKNV